MQKLFALKLALAVLCTAAFTNTHTAAQKAAVPGIADSSVVETNALASDPDAVSRFLSQKCAKVKAEKGTFRNRVSSYSFCAYPRVFWEDKIEGHPVYGRENMLFADMARAAYNQILASDKGLDMNALAQQTAKDIALNPRNLDSFRNIPYAAQNDYGYMAFVLASAYIQYIDYAQKITSNLKDFQHYEGYFKRLSGKELEFMTQGYNPDTDFLMAKSGLKPDVFYKRAVAIAEFALAYSYTARRLIGSVLAPLQTEVIEHKEAKNYLEERIRAEELPPGLNKAKLIEVLLVGVPSRAEAFRMANEENPSFKDKLIALDDLSSFRGSFKSNAVKAMGLMDYFAPSFYIERLSKHGTMSREVYIENVTNGILAAAVNKRLALVASELFEFEKPFYYTFTDIGKASYYIGKNWHEIATNQHFKTYPIAKIASDNLLNSGRRQFQDKELAGAIQSRRYLENSQKMADNMLYFVDQIVDGKMLLKNLVTPIAKGLKTANRANKTVTAANTVKKTAADIKFEKLQQNVKNTVGAVSKTAGNVNKGYGAAKQLLPLPEED